MAKVLTDRYVKSVRPDPAGVKRLELPDATTPGLYLVVQPGGGKSWAVRTRQDGRPRKITIGPFHLHTLAEARDRARDILRQISEGHDPTGAHRAAKVTAADHEAAAKEIARHKVEVVIADFITRHASRNRRAADVEAMFRRELTTWQGRDIRLIRKRDVIDLLDGVVDRGSPITANRLHAHLATVFTWCVGRDVLTTSPMAGVKPPSAEVKRDRVLSDVEIAAVWQATESVGAPFGALYRFLLLTGQRLREAAEMTAAEITGDMWTIPARRAKNGQEHAVPLSTMAARLLADMPRLPGKAGYLFTTTGLAAVSGFSGAKSRLDVLVDGIVNADRPDDDRITVPPFTIHDLRRTAATGMANLGHPPHVVEAVLNHISGTRRGVAGVYNRAAYTVEKRAALEDWAGHIGKLVAADG